MIVLIEAVVVEELLVKKLKEWFRKMDWSSIYPNHPIRINNEYPWVPYINETTGDVDIPEGDDQGALFPSITVVTQSDMKSPQEINVTPEDNMMLADDFTTLKADITAYPDKYMVSSDAISIIDTYFETSEELAYRSIPFRKRDNVQFDIVSDTNTDIKNRIYDALIAFLTGPENMVMREEQGVYILENTVSGSRSGEYNVEFGRTLHGCTIAFQVDYVVGTTFFDIDAEVVDSVIVNHTVE